MYMASNVSADTVFAIDGPTTTHSRYVGLYQNSALKVSMGLSGNSHYFIYDAPNNVDMFKC